MNYIITKTPENFSFDKYNFCELSDMKLPEVIAIDTETTGLQQRKEKIFCIQIGTGKDNYIIDMQNYSIGKSGYQPSDVFSLIKDKTLVFHNALFDVGFFLYHNFFPKKIFDTMVASKIIYNGDIANQRNDFASCMLRELGIYYDKTDQKNIATVKLTVPSTIKYSFNDVDKLVELHNVLYKKIVDGGWEKTYALHCKYLPCLAYIEQCGLPISSEKWMKKMEVDKQMVEKSSQEIVSYIYDNIPSFRKNQLSLFEEEKKISISLTSPLQMIKVFKKLDIPCVDKDGKDSINDDIISKSKHPFVKMWLTFQKANHRVTTFGENIYKQIENERIYTNFNVAVDTARLSVRRGNINFLNFPADKETRECFVANKGKDMIVCDYEGQENVIVADLSGDKAMTSSVINGDDLHCMLARVLFPEIKDLSDEEIVKNHKQKRQDSKAPRFKLNLIVSIKTPRFALN